MTLPSSSDLSPGQELAAARLAGGSTNRAAAKAAEVSERTIGTWKTIPAFRSRVDVLRAEMIGSSTGALTRGTRKAVRVLYGLMGDKSPPNIRLQAAKAFLEAALKLRAETDTADRLAQLEAEMERRNGGRGAARRHA